MRDSRPSIVKRRAALVVLLAALSDAVYAQTPAIERAVENYRVWSQQLMDQARQAQVACKSAWQAFDDAKQHVADRVALPPNERKPDPPGTPDPIDLHILAVDTCDRAQQILQQNGRRVQERGDRLTRELDEAAKLPPSSTIMCSQTGRGDFVCQTF